MDDGGDGDDDGDDESSSEPPFPLPPPPDRDWVWRMVSLDHWSSMLGWKRARPYVFFTVTCSASRVDGSGGTLTRTYWRSKRNPSLVTSAYVTSTGRSDLTGKIKSFEENNYA